MHHQLHGLKAVEAASSVAPSLACELIKRPQVLGVVVLSTCNRVTVITDHKDQVENSATTSLDKSIRTLLQGAAIETQTVIPMTISRDEEAIEQLFAIASGLDSMVVGEREISGQLRRALAVATRDGTASGTLVRIIEHALRTSRKVAHLTGLASTGRSVVAVGLDLASRHMTDFPGAKVLLIGTGSYAGATVAALRGRGVTDISVYSTSGRAKTFATGHGLKHVPPTGLTNALAKADLVVTCRGLGAPVLTTKEVLPALQINGKPQTILDLALNRDVCQSVHQLPEVEVIDLAHVQNEVPEVALQQVEKAKEIVHEGVKALLGLLQAMEVDPAVIALRETIDRAVAEELSRLPASGKIDVADAAQALRHLAARLAHTPSVRARKAASEGRAAEYLQAIAAVWGIDAAPGRCPVSGISMSEIGSSDMKNDAQKMRSGA